MTKAMKMTRGSGNVFRDLGFPEAEAQNLLLRTDLMIRIERLVQESDLTQQAAAKMLGITQPRLNLLLNGKVAEFSLDALVNMLAYAGLKVELKIKKASLRKAA